MTRNPRQIEQLDFTAGDLTRVVANMERLAVAEDGWINLLPKVADDDERPTSLRFFTLFGGGGNGITMATWIPASEHRGGRSQASLGITHVVAKRAVPELRTRAVAIPAAWLVEQDHPRRGLVVRIPFDESCEHVLTWALEAMTVLNPVLPTKGWRADIYLPATPS